MRLNAEFDKRIAVFASSMPWAPSPIAGVERRMLDRIGGEVARATSIVRYAPGSQFARHTHDGGEEFLVLDGVFQDEHGDYPAGTYVRNPIGSAHTPRADQGCVLFVKLWQFDKNDGIERRLDTRAASWRASRSDISTLPLHAHKAEHVRLERWPATAHIALGGEGGDELLVLNGAFSQESDQFVRLDWLRLPPGSSTTATAGPDGCTVWRKVGHLTPGTPLTPHSQAFHRAPQ